MGHHIAHPTAPGLCSVPTCAAVAGLGFIRFVFFIRFGTIGSAALLGAVVIVGHALGSIHGVHQNHRGDPRERSSFDAAASPPVLPLVPRTGRCSRIFGVVAFLSCLLPATRLLLCSTLAWLPSRLHVCGHCPRMLTSCLTAIEYLCFPSNVAAEWVGEIEAMVARVAPSTNARLLGLMLDKFKLRTHLAAIKKFLLLGQGDFVVCLMDALKPELDKVVAREALARMPLFRLPIALSLFVAACPSSGMSYEQ